MGQYDQHHIQIYSICTLCIYITSHNHDIATGCNGVFLLRIIIHQCSTLKNWFCLGRWARYSWNLPKAWASCVMIIEAASSCFFSVTVLFLPILPASWMQPTDPYSSCRKPLFPKGPIVYSTGSSIQKGSGHLWPLSTLIMIWFW